MSKKQKIIIYENISLIKSINLLRLNQLFRNKEISEEFYNQKKQEILESL